MRAAPSRYRHRLIVLLAAAAAISAAPAPSVRDVMRRVGRYVDAYGERSSILVATERYTQHTSGNTGATHTDRTIVAEFAIVNLGAATGWQGFRDVLEVDGEPLPNHEDRLIDMLIRGSSGYGEARRLSDESARFNIGFVARNFNVPTSTLFYFRSGNLDRFKFKAKDVGPDGTWHIAFEETYRPTFIRTPEGQSIPSDGEIWVNPTDGTIVRTLIRADVLATSRSQRAYGRIDVTYQRIDAVGMWLPQVMTEQFDTTAPVNKWERVEGRAAYSNYRQFTTSARIK